jgi:signal transduction histidine kinase
MTATQAAIVALSVALATMAVTGAGLAVFAWRTWRAVHRRSALQAAVAEAVSRSTSLEEISHQALSAIAITQGFDLGALWRVDRAEARLRFVGLWRNAGIDADRFHRESRDAEFEYGQGVLGGVWKAGAPAVVHDVARDERLVRRELLAGLGVRTVLYCPVRAHGETVGVIECFSREVRRADQQLLTLLDDIGRQIGVAIERAETDRALLASETQRRRVLEQMIQAEERTRAQLAADLHDDTVQVLTAAILELDRAASCTPGGEHERIMRARELLRQATERTRRLTFDLRPQLLTERGLGEALPALVADVAVDAGIEQHVNVRAGRYSETIETLIYRTVREALINVRKHARASRVDVVLRERAGALEAVVADDGVGFAAAAALDSDHMRHHLGLRAAIERVQMSGGDVTLETAPGRGTRLMLRVPLEEGVAMAEQTTVSASG